MNRNSRTPAQRAVSFTAAFACCLLSAWCARTASADIDEEPVALRIQLSLNRASAFTDTLGRSASVAYPLGSSVNPAAYDFLREPPYDFGALTTLTTNLVTFRTGTTVTGFSTNSAYRVPAAGTVYGSYIRTDSHEGDSRQGDEYDLASDELTLGYSHRLRRGLAVGGSVKLLDASLDVDDTYLAFPRSTESASDGLELKGGVLSALGERWLVGLSGSVGWRWTDIEGRVFLPPPPFGPGTVPIDEDVTSRTVDLRAGAGCRVSRALDVYLDYQYLHLYGGGDSVDVGRLLTGIEARPADAWFVRLGGSVDTEHEETISAGLGYHGIENLPIEMAYIYNAFPEVNREFGRNHLFSLSVVLIF